MLPELGIIEGYFGRCWSWRDRASVATLLSAMDYRFFHYAPKIDSKLRRDWQTRHDPAEAKQIRRFAQHCRNQNMRFGIGLTPYGAHFDFNDDVKAALKAKIQQLDSFGVDDLVILFDDMRGDIADLANQQADIIAFATDISKATRFFMCPSYYSDDPVLDRVFGERPDQYLETLGQRIDPAVNIYWTGEEVCSREYRSGHLHEVSEKLGRKISLWDNYPVNDGPRMASHLHLRAFTGRPVDIGDYVAHHAVNPASQPTLGCIPAITLAMSYMLGDTYRYRAAFSQAAVAVCGPELAAMLEADLLTFDDGGLDRIGERRDKLVAKYAAIDEPAAREVVDWLNGGYAVTGEMLQTQ